VVPSLGHKQLPYSWGDYGPQPIEVIIMASTFGAMALLYTLFAKFVPMISIWEMKVGLMLRETRQFLRTIVEVIGKPD